MELLILLLIFFDSLSMRKRTRIIIDTLLIEYFLNKWFYKYLYGKNACVIYNFMVLLN